MTNANKKKKKKRHACTLFGQGTPPPLPPDGSQAQAVPAWWRPSLPDGRLERIIEGAVPVVGGARRRLANGAKPRPDGIPVHVGALQVANRNGRLPVRLRRCVRLLALLVVVLALKHLFPKATIWK